MASAFDELEDLAYHQAKIRPGTKRGEIDDGQRKTIDNYIYNGVRRNPSVYANDPRASKYLKDDTTYEDRQALAQKEIAQGANPGGIWDDFGTGGFDQGATEEIPEEEQEDNNQNNDRKPDEEPEEEAEPEREESEGSDDENSPEQNEEAEPGPESEPGGEPAMGTDAAGEGASAAEEGASNLATGLGGAGEAAEGVGAAAEGAGAAAAAGEAAVAAEAAGAAAVEGGAVVAATSEVWLPILAIVVLFFLILGIFTAIAWNNPDTASATTNDTTSSVSGSIPDKVTQIAYAEYKKGVKETPLGSNTGGELNKYFSAGGCSAGNPWCAAFVSYVFKEAGANGPRSCSSCAAIDFFSKSPHKKLPLSSNVPQPGDTVWHSRTGGCGHIGIVYKVDGTKIITIEGNSGDKVSMVTYSNYGRGTWEYIGRW